MELGGDIFDLDAAFLNEKAYNPEQESIERKAFNRQKVNEQLHSLFS